MSAYVTKAEVEPFTMIPGFAANAYHANMATMDGNGAEIATDYAKKTELEQKQDKLPYNAQWDVYDVGCWSAVNATRDVNGKDIDTTYATKQELASYVTKTDVVPSQTNEGAAENAVRAVYASYDGDGNLIDYFYAKKEELNAKQDALPYGAGVYGIKVSSAASVPWSGVENKPAAITLAGTYEDGTTFTFNLQGA